MTLLEKPTTPFTKKDAIELARLLNADLNDPWTYKAIHIPEAGYSIVVVYDEDSAFLGRL